MARRRRRRKVKYSRIVLLFLLLASFVIMGLGFGLVVGALATLPDYDLNHITGDLPSILYDKNDQEVIPLRSEKNRVEISQNEIPEIMKKAIIAIEDQRFEKHHGFDFYRFGGAIIANITKGYGSQGGSTITQQLVKNAILKNHEKRMRRKIQELYIALQLESKYSKEQILAFYLNNVYYGEGAWSLQTAAQVYFGKDAEELNLAEAAMLAGVVNAPNRYSPYKNEERAKQRRALVLNEMVKMNYITKDEAEKAKEEPFNLVGLQPNNYQYQSFIDYVIEEAAEKLKLNEDDISSLYTAGYRIYTTMDARAQKAAEAVYADDKNFPAGKKDKIVQSAMVVLDPHNGGIRVIIGGRNQQGERQFNRAVNATRQPGSAMKPIAVYGPALEKGYSPATVLDDFPQQYDTGSGKKTFVNYDGRYRGLISMRTGIQHSINTVAVKMLQQIGVREGINFTKSLGITTLVENGEPNDIGLSFALGGLTKGVSPLELTAAYGCFANGGIYVKPYAIRKIEDKDGNIIYENKIMKKQVMSPQTAYLMSDMLQTVVTAGTAPRAALPDRPVAGKTGTTSFNVDAWFVGYTPDLVGSVWLGYDKTENMNNVFGGNYGAPIWKKVMTVAHQDMPPSTFPVPEGITTLTVDYKSGLLPDSLTPEKYLVQEKFNSAYIPTEVSNVWVQVPVCVDTGQLLTNNCPNSITGVFLKRPIPWTGNIAPEDAVEEVPKDYCTLHGGEGYYGEYPDNGPPPLIKSSFKLDGELQTNSNGTAKTVTLSWENKESTSSTYYQIYRSIDPNVPVTARNLLAEVSNTTTWRDNHPISANKFYYRVVALKSGHSEKVSSNVLEINLPNNKNSDLEPPYLTGQAYRSGSTNQVILNWTKSSEDRPIIYHIYRSETSNFEPNFNNQIALNETITELSWTDRDVERHKTYYYRVRGVDMLTNEFSGFSNQIKVNL
ncbi:MAG: PBP1A family penicillin-binding protein [Clostridia bacterium]|jgi:penicillin-binding protein 1A|nr:PBP1A family penicillin-binding protein [Clostridia bacterium]